MRQKLNLKDKCQISKPNEYTDNVKSNLTCIFLSVRAKLKITLYPRKLCTYQEKFGFNPNQHKRLVFLYIRSTKRKIMVC